MVLLILRCAFLALYGYFLALLLAISSSINIILKNSRSYILFYFSLAPNTIYYAQESRNYAMLLALASIFCTLLYCVFESMYYRLTLKRPMYYFVGILICGVAMVLTHYYAYIFVFSTGMIALIQAWRTKQYFIPLFIIFTLMGAMGVMWIGIHHYYGDFLHRMNSEWVYDKSLYFLLLSIPLSALGKFGWIFVILFYAFCFKQIPLKVYRQYAPLLYIVGLELCIIIAIFMSISQTITTRYFVELYPLIYLFLASILVYASRYAVFYIPALTLILVAHITAPHIIRRIYAQRVPPSPHILIHKIANCLSLE